jgi:hypothetical protein
MKTEVMVVTYYHILLYVFANVTSAGMTNEQRFDNVWFAVSSECKMVGKATEVSINLTPNPLLGSYLVGSGGQVL